MAAQKPIEELVARISANPGHENITNGELREQSVRFAAALTTLGVGRGDPVALLMAETVEFAVALLGLQRLGAVAVPLPATLDRDAVAGRVHAAGARLAVADADQRRKLLPAGDTPNDASPLVVVARGDAFGYDVSFAEMTHGTGAFAELPPEPGDGGGH
ncbi:AMP-binding protein [Specibacter sp. RAF43]|uniref:AMP-binding protein n=1 Tax=Specibacter sp. RAF43 TaxID=3233057 RepID=UPI003F9D3CDD